MYVGQHLVLNTCHQSYGYHTVTVLGNRIYGTPSIYRSTGKILDMSWKAWIPKPTEINSVDDVTSSIKTFRDCLRNALKKVAKPRQRMFDAFRIA